MYTIIRQSLTKEIQKVFWFYSIYLFVITEKSQLNTTQPSIQCTLVPVTSTNYQRVQEFRHYSRIKEYKSKLENNELGFFAESNYKMVGSIWATINRGPTPVIARRYMKLMPDHALIHDVVAADNCRGRGVGPFMIKHMADHLLQCHAVRSIIIDISVNNRSSLRMMSKLHLQPIDKVLCLSALGRLIAAKHTLTAPCVHACAGGSVSDRS